jgi:hypothetical protein
VDLRSLNLAEPSAELNQSTYHGSPARFDRFDLSHMGEGEGAQAYGWGAYFAGNRSLAEWYRETLTGRPGQPSPTEKKFDGKNVMEWYKHWERLAERAPVGEAQPFFDRMALLEALELTWDYDKTLVNAEDMRGSNLRAAECAWTCAFMTRATEKVI